MLAVEDYVSSNQIALTALVPRRKERFAASMRSRIPLPKFFVAALFAILLFVSLPATAAPPLVGTYKITENTDLGTDIRLTLQLTLVNPGDTAVNITRVGLHSISASGRLVSTASSVVVQSHANSQVSLQFLIAKKDFNAWQVGPHQQFLITLQPTGGPVSLVNLPLLRTRE